MNQLMKCWFSINWVVSKEYNKVGYDSVHSEIEMKHELRIIYPSMFIYGVGYY